MPPRHNEGKEGDKVVTQKLRALRGRAGLSKQQVAIAGGWKGATSYARYENPDLFTRPVLPLDVCLRLVPALVGRGSPPITRAEVMELAGIDRSGNEAVLALAMADLNAAVDDGRLKEALGHAHIVLGHLMLMS